MPPVPRPSIELPRAYGTIYKARYEVSTSKDGKKQTITVYLDPIHRVALSNNNYLLIQVKVVYYYGSTTMPSGYSVTPKFYKLSRATLLTKSRLTYTFTTDVGKLANPHSVYLFVSNMHLPPWAAWARDKLMKRAAGIYLALPVKTARKGEYGYYYVSYTPPLPPSKAYRPGKYLLQDPTIKGYTSIWYLRGYKAPTYLSGVGAVSLRSLNRRLYPGATPAAPVLMLWPRRVVVQR